MNLLKKELKLHQIIASGVLGVLTFIIVSVIFEKFVLGNAVEWAHVAIYGGIFMVVYIFAALFHKEWFK